MSSSPSPTNEFLPQRPSPVEYLRQRAQTFLHGQVSDRAYRGDIESAHRVKDLMTRLKIPSTRAMDLFFISTLRPLESLSILKTIPPDDPTYSEAIIARVRSLGLAGNFAQAKQLLQENDAIITRKEPNAKHLLSFWLSFNYPMEALKEMRKLEQAKDRSNEWLRTAMLLSLANNSLIDEMNALLAETHQQDIVISPTTYDRIMAAYGRFNRVADALTLTKEIQRRCPLHWQRSNSSLKSVVEVLLNTSSWTEENRKIVLDVRRCP